MSEGAEPVASTIDGLLGTWAVARTIEDHRTSTRGTFVGTATINPLDADDDPAVVRRARYVEDGELCFGSHVGPASRALTYEELAEGVLRLRFEDGRPFVEVDLSSGAWEGVHPCGEDVYAITMVVHSPERREELWVVRGPAKDYDAHTVLSLLERHVGRRGELRPR